MVSLNSDCIALVMHAVAHDDLPACCGVNCVWRAAGATERTRRARRLCGTALAWVARNPNFLVLAGSMAAWKDAGGPSTWWPAGADVFLYGAVSGTTSLFAPPLMGGKFPADEAWVTTSADRLWDRVRVTNKETPDGVMRLVLSSCFKTVGDVLDASDVSASMVAYVGNGERVFGQGHLRDVVMPYVPRISRPLVRVIHAAAEHGHSYSDDAIGRVLAVSQTRRTLRRARLYEARGFGAIAKPVTANRRQMMFASAHVGVGCVRFRCALDEAPAPACECDGRECPLCEIAWL